MQTHEDVLMIKDKSQTPTMKTRSGLSVNLYAVEELPEIDNLIKADRRMGCLWTSDQVFAVEVTVQDHKVYFIYNMANITHAEDKIIENLAFGFDHYIELSDWIIYCGQAYYSRDRTGLLIINAVKMGVPPEAGVLLS
jgi:hypothetical protein